MINVIVRIELLSVRYLETLFVFDDHRRNVQVPRLTIKTIQRYNETDKTAFLTACLRYR